MVLRLVRRSSIVELQHAQRTIIDAKRAGPDIDCCRLLRGPIIVDVTPLFAVFRASRKFFSPFLSISGAAPPARRTAQRR